MLRKELQDHEDNKCPNRLVQCQYCNTEGMHKEITAEYHLDKCSFFPISCPNNCGHEKIQRMNLADHQEVCPLEPVKCPFFEAGCTEMIARKDLAEHQASNTEHHLELLMTQTVTLKQNANKSEQKANKFEQQATQFSQEVKTTKDQLQQLSLKYDGLVSYVTKQLGTIDSDPQNTQTAIKNIKSFTATMLAPGDTRYLPLVQESWCRARSASFYIEPGYKLCVDIDCGDNCTVYLEKGEHDHKLEWPMPEMEIELSTRENIILHRATLCTRCGLTVNRLEGDRTEQDINKNPHQHLIGPNGFLRKIVFLAVKKHVCTKRNLD
ncbi:TNF receptor-associated factor 2-like [Halichondria panicea]|uniref:TNF receptor-associated factor 2-like n=1 Tax=Halichondria panicea TaxID=6063 RepID=UPI00312B7FD9